MNRRTFVRDVVLAIALFALHALLGRELAGDAIVSALFAPKGPHATWTLVLGSSFVVLRVVLFVGVPGWVVAQLLLGSAELGKSFLERAPIATAKGPRVSDLEDLGTNR